MNKGFFFEYLFTFIKTKHSLRDITLTYVKTNEQFEASG